MKTLTIPKINLPGGKFNHELLRAEIASFYSVTESEIDLSLQSDGVRTLEKTKLVQVGKKIERQKEVITETIEANLKVTGPDEMTLGGLIQLMVAHNPAKDDAEQAQERGVEQLYNRLKQSPSFQAEVLNKLP